MKTTKENGSSKKPRSDEVIMKSIANMKEQEQEEQESIITKGALKKSKPAKKDDEDEKVVIPGLIKKVVTVPIRGLESLIVHRFSDKNEEMIRAKQAGEARDKKAPRNPEQEYLDSMYEISPGRYGFPSTGFKKSAVSACRYVDGISMSFAKGAFHILGSFVEILSDDPPKIVNVEEDERFAKPQMRTDIVRIGGMTKVADLRYRGEFVKWGANLRILYNSAVINLQQLFHLINVSGFAIGVGEWRPERGGPHGMYEISE